MEVFHRFFLFLRPLLLTENASLNLRGGDLAVRVRYGQHLVAGVFDRAGLVRGNVAGVRRNDALMGAQDRGDHGQSGL